MSDLNEQLAALKAAAEAATPGPWVETKYCAIFSVKNGENDECIVTSDTTKSDRAFIATANPAAILALIAEVEAARRAPAAAPAPVAASDEPIPTWEEAEARFDAGTGDYSALDFFIYSNEPAGDTDETLFRAQLQAAINEVRRAALATAPAAAPIVQPDRMQFVHAIMCKLDEYGLAVRDDNADWRLRVRGEIFDSLAGSAPAADAAGQSEKEKLFDYLTALATEAGFPNISTAIAEARWSGRAASTPATDPCELSEAEFLSLRLGRVAKLVGVPMPSGTHEQIAGIAPVILGAIARHLEARTAAATSADAQPTPASSTADTKDAARWRETLKHVGGMHTDVGAQRFTLRYLSPLEGANIMRGGVAGHFTQAIDAAIASSAGEVKP